MKFKNSIGIIVAIIVLLPLGKDNPDAKSSLIGRLLMRKMIHDFENVFYPDIKLQRTSKGKPYYSQTNSKYSNFNFNVSHQGDYVVAGCETDYLLGIDVMKVEPRGSSTSEFFRDMRNCFTNFEWSTIENSVNPLESFYEHWTLKEGYIKAVGIGLGFELQRAQFTIDMARRTSKIAIDGVNRKDWHFELHVLPKDHVVTVAYGPPNEVDESCHQIMNIRHTVDVNDSIPRTEFKSIGIRELVENMTPLTQFI